MTENPEFLWSYVEAAIATLENPFPPYINLYIKAGKLRAGPEALFDKARIYIATVTHQDLAEGFSDRSKSLIIGNLQEARKQGLFKF